MPTLAGPPLQKVTLNLYEADVTLGEKLYGRGWTTILRDVWASHLTKVSENQPAPRKLKLGDLDGR